jgi:hypothetical protein
MKTIRATYAGSNDTIELNGASARLFVALLLIAVIWFAGLLAPASAQTPEGGDPGNDHDTNCLLCHANPNFLGTLENGEPVSLTVDQHALDQSVHGPAGLECTACHTELTRYPHHTEVRVGCRDCHSRDEDVAGTEETPLVVELPFADRQAMTLSIGDESCRSCHEQELMAANDSAHAAALYGDSPDALTCIDCHGSHEIISPASVKTSGANETRTGHDMDCLLCHADPEFQGIFENGESISLYVDQHGYEQSIHGPAGLECIACHTELASYPHHSEVQVGCRDCHGQGGAEAGTPDMPPRVKLPFARPREMTLAINDTCRSCHEQEFNVAEDSAHVEVLKGGNPDAPICVDCHGSHEIASTAQSRTQVSHMCGECHRAVYSTYRTSIHGAALDAESNPDVPTCTDCHGVHNVRGPHDTSFRNDSITICGDCHSNEEMMQKYGLSTAVFETYLDDFHGRTVDLFRRGRSELPSNKAVCYDCHGIHNIRSADDPLSTIYPDNLQHTCEQCHTEADIKFPQAWVSHYLPTWQDTPALYVVNTFYKLLIPLTLGGFVLYIGLDAGRRWIERRDMIYQARIEEELDDYDLTH